MRDKVPEELDIAICTVEGAFLNKNCEKLANRLLKLFSGNNLSCFWSVGVRSGALPLSLTLSLLVRSTCEAIV